MVGKNATPLIGWHSTDPTLKPWLEAERERRGMETMRELLDEMAAEYRAARELTSSFQPGDVIAVPAEVIRVTQFRDTSRLVIKQRKAWQRGGECKACGTAFTPGDLYAASTEPTSHRCIRCVDGWPLAGDAC